jgi:hypothetical protein
MAVRAMPIPSAAKTHAHTTTTVDQATPLASINIIVPTAVVTAIELVTRPAPPAASPD